MSRVIRKSLGITASERRLATICEQTFLSMWSYPNLYRSQKIHRGRSGGKEFCDLLVVCGNDLILFSDKSCSFPNTGNVHTDWSRWFRRSVLESTKQVHGAERWLRAYPDRVFLDEACTQPFPFLPQAIENCRFSRVVVARNATERCSDFMGGTGTLAIDPDIEGSAHATRTHPAYRPFAIGNVDPDRGFIHVFDDLSLSLVLSEVNTITDFVHYLRARECFITSKGLFWSSGEEDLIAVYIAHTRESGEHYFPPAKAGGRVKIEDGAWFDLLDRPEFQSKKNADQKSYIWDAIIQEFSHHTLAGTLYKTTISANATEHALRIMAAENRFHRRVLGERILEKIQTVRHDMIGVRILTSPSNRDTSYIFLLYPRSKDISDDDYRVERRAFISDYCYVYSYLHPGMRHIIGITTESGLGLDRRSHDLLYVPSRNWTPQEEMLARDVQRARKILLPTTVSETYGRAYEFPPDDETQKQGNV